MKTNQKYFALALVTVVTVAGVSLGALSMAQTVTTLQCSSNVSSVAINQAEVLTATGGNGFYAWSGPNLTVTNATGNQFAVSYSSSGVYPITVSSVGIAWNAPGEMGIPTNFTDVGWYNGGPRPGMTGSAVIDGHLDGKHTPRAVFFDLGKLSPGDLVNVVDKNGSTFQFSVVAVKTYDYNASTSDIFSSDDSKAHLNLITCAGDWIKSRKLYDKRVVVFTDLVAAN
jgi:hypothetical protein